MTEIGDTLRGKYHLIRLLGDGGMGAVYEASHEMLGTRVAIKILHANVARRAGLADRFLQEARVAAQIRSPNVVNVTDVDRTEEGVVYIVMELLEGEPLSSVLERQAKLPIPLACEYATQILLALEAAHALGVVHRDLKPENVFVTYVGTRPVLKLIDFGIAKLRREGEAKNLTLAGVVMGTAEYMAPEQAYSADRADARSDLYAVGVMLYEMIAGERPVNGDDARSIAVRVERGEVIPLVHAAPEVPRELAGLVHRAMAARPELRFASATEMRLALESARTGPRVKTAPVAAVEAGPVLPSAFTVQGVPAADVFTGVPAPPQAGGGSGHTLRAPAPNTPWFGESSVHEAGLRPSSNAPPFGQPESLLARLTPAPPALPRRRSMLGFVIGIPVILGVGTVVAFMAFGRGGAWSSEAPPAVAAPGVAPAAPTAVAAPGPLATGSAAPPSNASRPLEPLEQTRPPPSSPGRAASAAPGATHPGSPHPSASAGHPAPSSSSSSSAPPASPGDNLPSFPIPFPSALPFPLPNFADGGGFPFPLPSGLPFPLPNFGGPAPAPSPSDTSSPPPLPSTTSAPGPAGGSTL